MSSILNLHDARAAISPRPSPQSTMNTVDQQDSPLTCDSYGAANGMLMSWLTTRQPPIVSPSIVSQKKRGHTNITDEDVQPATQKRKSVDDSCIVTPRLELSPTSQSDVMICHLPLLNPMGSEHHSFSPTEDIKFGVGTVQEAAASMDDEPVWDSMADNEESFAFSSSQQPRTVARKVSANEYDVDTKEDNLTDGLFGWFSEDPVQDIKRSKSPTEASLVSGSSSNGSNEDDEAKQPFLQELPTVSLEDNEASGQLLNAMGDIDDAGITLDEPVFEDAILDPTGTIFDFNEPPPPLLAAESSFSGEESTPYIASLDPLPYATPPSVPKPTLKGPKQDQSKQQDSKQAMDMLANVADAVATEMKEDPLTAKSSLKSNNENGMMTSHHFSGKKSRKSGGPWMKKFDQLRDYVKENGHCNVPQKYPANPALGRWVARQRLFLRQYLDAQMGADVTCPQIDIEERVKLLRGAGLLASACTTKRRLATNVPAAFISCRNTREWDNRFAELLRYKSIHGDCDVPVKTDGDFKSLGRWVTSQRKKYKDFHSGQLVGENTEQFETRFRRLEEIGFKFKIGSGRGLVRVERGRGKGKKKNDRATPTPSE